MEQTWSGPRERLATLVWAAFAALGLTAAGVGALWFRSAEGGNWPALLAAAVVVLLAGVGVVWFARARAWRRWRAGLDRFAERELSRRARPRTSGF
jgi:hypothetical protein